MQIQDLLGYFTVLMYCVHIFETNLLVSYYKYGFFAISGAWTVFRGHCKTKMLARAKKALVFSLVYDAVNGTMSEQNALRTHAMVFFAACLCNSLLKAPRGCLLILLVQHGVWALNAPLSSLYPKAIGECYDVSFTVSGCANIGHDYPPLCSDERCLNHVQRELRSWSINTVSQWNRGYRVCESTACEWQPQHGGVHSTLFGPLGLIPCSYAFAIGALYEHMRHSKVFTRLLLSLGFALLVFVAYLDRATFVEDLFLGDPLSTLMLSVISCFHMHRVHASFDKPCRGTVVLHWFARHSACIYACQPLLRYARVTVSESSAMVIFVAIVASLTSLDTPGVLVDTFAPSIVYALVGGLAT